MIHPNCCKASSFQIEQCRKMLLQINKSPASSYPFFFNLSVLILKDESLKRWSVVSSYNLSGRWRICFLLSMKCRGVSPPGCFSSDDVMCTVGIYELYFPSGVLLNCLWLVLWNIMTWQRSVCCHLSNTAAALILTPAQWWRMYSDLLLK